LASGLGFEAQKNLSFVFFQKTQMKNSYPSYFEFKTTLCNVFHYFFGSILNCSKTMAKNTSLSYLLFFWFILLTFTLQNQYNSSLSQYWMYNNFCCNVFFVVF
jgi:hypothetical protein